MQQIMTSAQWRIVVPVHNALKHVELLLNHLKALNTQFPASVILVDDGSTDGTSDFVALHYPEVRVVRGDGNLWWGGGIRLGMETALRESAEIIFWLNHDCFPLGGAFEKLALVLQDSNVGCVSAWCRMRGYPDYPVNPGFVGRRQLTMPEGASLVPVDGVNGNFVGFRCDAVRRVGLPDPQTFPHYGDGVYTLRFSRARYKVLVCREAKADLDYELERRLSPFWRVAVNKGGLVQWFRYFFLSPRSLFHIRNRYQQTRFLRGAWQALPRTLLINSRVTCEIICGFLLRKLLGTTAARKKCVQAMQKSWPAKKLETELSLLEV